MEAKIEITKDINVVNGVIAEASPYASTGQTIHAEGYFYMFHDFTNAALAENYPSFAGIWDNDADDDYAAL